MIKSTSRIKTRQVNLYATYSSSSYVTFTEETTQKITTEILDNVITQLSTTIEISDPAYSLLSNQIDDLNTRLNSALSDISMNTYTIENNTYTLNTEQIDKNTEDIQILYKLSANNM